jgi:hypothetical protein
VVISKSAGLDVPMSTQPGNPRLVNWYSLSESNRVMSVCKTDAFPFGEGSIYRLLRSPDELIARIWCGHPKSNRSTRGLNPVCHHCIMAASYSCALESNCDNSDTKAAHLIVCYAYRYHLYGEFPKPTAD